MTLTICPDCDGQKLMHGHDCDCPTCDASGLVTLQSHVGHSLENDTWFVRFYPFGSEEHAKAFEERIQSPIAALQSSPPAVDREEAITVTIFATGDHENTPAEAVHHGLAYAAKAGFISSWTEAALASQHAGEGEAVAWRIGETGIVFPDPRSVAADAGVREEAREKAEHERDPSAPKTLSPVERRAQADYVTGLEASIASLEAERDDARRQRDEIGRAWDEADARAKEAEARAARLEKALAEAREALEDAEDTLRLVERPAFRDPRHGDEVEALGLRIGFGALMASASASWRERLAADGDPVGGEFVAGPCHNTVVSTLAKIRRAAALSTSNGGRG